MQNRCNLRPIHPPTSQIKSPIKMRAFYLTEFGFAKALVKLYNSNKFTNYILFQIALELIYYDQVVIQCTVVKFI